ncbi:hypothetical protein GTO89_00565 [Heliobacterium gestii]|uniref:Uncharacterized protein n=1 Tax=Heliomicrobium gestii TaxID=2699 RepID=A0A845LD88_HELGE|nr:hypothetical protein [Heliomicrobium gestii]MBM7865258.1 hypothetical protein [Heliomicrobium gestii]MZP41523.1 hypothetical protein [Heliomicrobium gestii]
MTNLFWYHSLTFIGIGLIIFTMYKRKSIVNLFSFYLFISALAYLCEIVILFVFNSYAYKPGLFTDPIQESIYGHLVCNGFFWGGFTLLVAAFQLKYYWIFLISVVFMLVEVLFLALGIYTHHWWRTYMTGIAVVVFLFFARKCFGILMEKKHMLLRYTAFYLIAWLLLLGSSIVLLISDKQHFGIGLVDNYFLNDIFFDVPYQLIMSLTFIFFVNFLHKPYWKTAPLFVVLLSDYMMIKMNILTFQNGWNLFYLTQLHYLCLGLYIVLEKYSLKGWKTPFKKECPNS